MFVVPSQPVGGQDGMAEDALLLEDSLRAHYKRIFPRSVPDGILKEVPMIGNFRSR